MESFALDFSWPGEQEFSSRDLAKVHCGSTADPREFPAFPWAADSRRATSKIVAYGGGQSRSARKSPPDLAGRCCPCGCARLSPAGKRPLAKRESAMRGATHIAKVHLGPAVESLGAAQPRRHTPSGIGVESGLRLRRRKLAERASRRGAAFLSDPSSGSSPTVGRALRPLPSLISVCGAPPERCRVVVGRELTPCARLPEAAHLMLPQTAYDIDSLLGSFRLASGYLVASKLGSRHRTGAGFTLSGTNRAGSPRAAQLASV
jgi:hypothetical protein